MKLRFKLVKGTRGAVRFAECNADGKIVDTIEDQVIGALYVRKAKLGQWSGEWAFKGKAPAFIEVTLAEAE